jgi:LPS-assembly lipoprotein
VQHRVLMLFLAVLLLSGCGFHLRGTQQTQQSANINQLVLDSYDPYGPLTRIVRSDLATYNIAIVQDAKRRDIPSLRLTGEGVGRLTASIFRDGTTAEYQMSMTVTAQLLIPGHDIYPLQVTVFRSFFDNSLAALAKDAEQDLIITEMRDDASAQLLRHMLAVYDNVTSKTAQKLPAPATVYSKKPLSNSVSAQ